MENITTISNLLFQEWKKNNPNLKKSEELLEKTKIVFLQMSFLPVGNVTISVHDLKMTRDILEIGVEHSIMVKNVLSFERYISQLKAYYYDYKKLIGESNNKYKILGLNLLYLLSQNRVADFHTELELLPAEIIQKNEFIRYPLALEQYIMEGRYNKIFVAKTSAPAEIYNFFIDTLVETRKWTLNSHGYYVFLSETIKHKEPLPAVNLAEQAIFYARELEMIV
uniref:CSON005642 protein n=1 Tax=Culicoides sonorensis TaxID=179676 RepID=A0A336LWC7_CULSO